MDWPWNPWIIHGIHKSTWTPQGLPGAVISPPKKTANQLTSSQVASSAEVPAWPHPKPHTVTRPINESTTSHREGTSSQALGIWDNPQAATQPEHVAGGEEHDICYGVKRGSASRSGTSPNPQTPTPNLTPIKNTNHTF